MSTKVLRTADDAEGAGAVLRLYDIYSRYIGCEFQRKLRVLYSSN